MYDPSEPYRMMLNPPPPPPPPVSIKRQSTNQYRSDPTLSQEYSSARNNPGRSNTSRIPQYYTSQRDELNDIDSTNPYYPVPNEMQHNSSRFTPTIEPPASNEFMSHSQPDFITTDPYASDQQYPYAESNHLPYVSGQPVSNNTDPSYRMPYLIPVGTSVPQVSSRPSPRLRVKPTVVYPHSKDPDLSRLEVYHFNPKQNTPITVGTVPVQPVQPMLQYYPQPYPVMPGPMPMPAPLLGHPQPYMPYPYPVYGQPPYVQPPYTYPSYEYQQYDVDPYAYNYPPDQLPFLPLIQTRARGVQTEPPKTHTRAVSPMHEHSTAFDRNGYPYVHQRVMLMDRHYGAPVRTDQKIHNGIYSTPLPDCRCIHCQRERAKILNYYSD